jgi:hypothetical protein
MILTGENGSTRENLCPPEVQHRLSWDRTSDCLRHGATCRPAGKCGGVGPWESFSFLRCSWETIRFSNKIVSYGVPCIGLPRCGSLLSALRGCSLGHRPAQLLTQILAVLCRPSAVKVPLRGIGLGNGELQGC